MINRIQQLPPRQRRIVFWGIMIGGVLALALLTVWLIFGAINAQDAGVSVALAEDITVRVYAELPGEMAYPAAVAALPGGGAITGSYQTGALWVIDSDGAASEIAGSNEAIGAVAGLTAAPDGTVYIVDQVDADPRTGGGDVKIWSPEGGITTFATISDERGFVAPDDVTVDAAGNVYVSDRGRDEVWRFNPDGGGGIAWWTSPQTEGAEQYAPTGMAYDPSTDTILITDSSLNIIYRVPMDGARTDIVYQHGDRPNEPIFDGIAVTPDGTIYVAALAQDGVARVDGEELTYIAGLFRGPSDVDYSPTMNALYVTNFDSGALVVPGLTPRLPFTIDLVNLPPP